MKGLIIFFCILGLSCLAAAQGLINNGAHITLTAGSYIIIEDTVLGNYENRSGGLISNSGNIRLKANWLNNSTTTVFTSNAGSVDLAGGSQLIGGSGSTYFYNLTISGSGVKKVMLNTIVGGGFSGAAKGILNLNDRLLDLNNYKLLLLNSDPSGMQGSSGYILADSAGTEYGTFIWRTGLAVAGNTYTIPFGRRDGYLVPWSLHFTANGGGSDSSGFSVSTYGTLGSLVPGNRPFPAGVNDLNNPFGAEHSANTLDRFWTVGSFGYTTDPPGDLLLGYADDEWDASGGGENTIFENELGLLRWEAGKWQFPPEGATDVINNRLAKSGSSPFGIFTIANPVECPKAWFTFKDVCQREGVQFYDSTSFRKGSLTNWSWEFGDSSFSSDAMPLHTYLQYGDLPVRLKVTLSSGCSDSVIRTIRVFPRPVAGLSLQGPFCGGNSIGFTDKSTTPQGLITSRSWDMGNGQQDTVSDPNSTYNPGIYNLRLIAENSFACRDTLDSTIHIYNKPVAGFILNDLCNNDSAIISNTSFATDAPLVSFIWDLGDGSSSTQAQPRSKYVLPGNYAVNLIVTDSNHCSDSITANVNVFPNALAAFDFGPKNVNYLSPLVNFFNQSSNSSSWYWDFGDGFGSNAFEDDHTYGDTGFYKVILTANNVYNCPDTVSHSVYVEPVFQVFVPSAFSPNSDLLNDTFGPEGLPMGAHNCRFSIYNRWGQLVFRSTDIKDRWNGTYLGDPAPPGAYAYEFIMDDYKGANHFYTGVVTLLK